MKNYCIVNYRKDAIDKRDFLTQNELRQYFDKLISKRKNWLVGRLSAKKVIQTYVADKTGIFLDLSDIEIISFGGKPSFKIRNYTSIFVLRELKNILDLSISHANNKGVATVSLIRKDGKVGIDGEKKRIFDDNFLESFLNISEINKLKKMGDEYKTVFWCIKEAYSKALGVGLRLHPKKIEIDLFKKGKGCKIKVNNILTKSLVDWRILEDDFVVAKVNLK